MEMSSWWAHNLHEATKAYINDHINIPINPYGTWTLSQLTNDLAHEIHEHLQSIGAYVRAQDVVEYLDRDEQWMKLMDYRWIQNHCGHKCSDVVDYRQNVFLRKWAAEEGRMHSWGTNLEEICSAEQPLCVWKSRWVHKNTSAIPYAKGEGASLMAADFVSADHGWLQSPDGKESVWVLFKAGKSRDGYFSNEEILIQCQKAMDIVQTSWPNEDHMFVFDNVTTHLKCPNGSLGIPKVGTNWGVEVTARNLAGKIIYGTDGKPSKTKIRMANGTFKDGSAQSLYFPEGHACRGVFKGMATILEECGYSNTSNIQAECKPNFTCKSGIPQCYCQRMLYNEADFINVKSTLELACDTCGIGVLFLAKFHCELNFIEQCWGHAKRIYHQKPPSSSEQDLETNLIDALDSVTVEQMRKYAQRSCRFMNAYQKGLSGKQAAWATKKYCGHRVLPNSVLAELEAARI
ncbi:hypothetical protein BDR04DRAFT_1130802 [Suillus decipiens]|nr:hypothetical protein BDR04DRAFT_1130802 [Suillus decipiens]